MLILADLHLGKTAYFRASGIQIPSTLVTDDLNRLSQLVEQFHPEKIVVAGDMFHHNYNADIRLFKQWRQLYARIEVILVPGNHDKLLAIDYKSLQISITEAVWVTEPFAIVHNPSDKNELFSICGHIHAGHTMVGRARQSLHLPCFIVSKNEIVLPAFSRFTGLYTGYAATAHSKYYVIANEKIHAV